MDRGNIWIILGIILLLCFCHTLLTGIYPVRTLFPTTKETIDRQTDSRRNLRKQTSSRRTVSLGSSPVVLSHSGQLLATTRNFVWNEPTQVELRSFKDGSIVRTLEGSGRFVSFVFNPDDSLIAAGTFNDIYIWRTDNGQLLRKLPTTSFYSTGPSLDFSTDGKKLVSRGKKHVSYLEHQIVKPSYSEQQIIAWDVTSGQLLYSLNVRDQFVSVSPDGKFFAVGGRGSFMQLYHLDNATLLRQLSLIGYPQFVSDDKILISTTTRETGYRVLLYQITSDTTSPQLFSLISNIPGGGISSPDGRFLIGSAGRKGGGGGDFFVAAPRIQEPKVVAYMLWQMDGPYPLPLKKFFVRKGPGQWPRLFTPDGKFLLVGGDLWRLPLVHPWLGNALLVVSVAMVIFFADRSPPIR